MSATTAQRDNQVNAQPAFRAEGLTKVYRMGEVEVHALRGVDLELYAGEFVVELKQIAVCRPLGEKRFRLAPAFFVFWVVKRFS